MADVQVGAGTNRTVLWQMYRCLPVPTELFYGRFTGGSRYQQNCFMAEVQVLAGTSRTLLWQMYRWEPVPTELFYG